LFPDFLFPELTLVLDEAPLQQHFLRGHTPLLSALLAALLVLGAVWLILQQWYQRQRLSQALQDAEASLREQMRSNARQRLTLQHHTLELEGLNQHLQNARQRMELSERLAGLGELSAGIAHEINNPVAYVRSNLQTLAEDFAALAEFIDTLDKASDELDLHSPVFQRLLRAYQQLQIADILKQAPARLTDCRDGIERVARIVSDMRNLSRSGFDKHWCQVNDDIRSAINIARSRLPAGVSLDAELIPLPDIYCNPSQIAQVVMNILVNAIQVLEQRGGRIELRETCSRDELRIVIEDDGPGMDEQTAARVFEPFFTTKLEGEGTGLGLALCYKLMQAHAGRIELTTGSGQGAQFTLILPVNGGAEHAE
jgi:signal transduction histidine kinase